MQTSMPEGQQTADFICSRMVNSVITLELVRSMLLLLPPRRRNSVQRVFLAPLYTYDSYDRGQEMSPVPMITHHSAISEVVDSWPMKVSQSNRMLHNSVNDRFSGSRAIAMPSRNIFNTFESL